MASLLQGFAESARRHPDRTALHLGQRRFSYAQLAARAGAIADAIATGGLSRRGLVGLLASQELTAYTGTLAILGARKGIVPIDPDHPPARILATVRHAGVDTLVVGEGAVDRLEPLLDAIDRPLSIIAPEVPPLRGLAARHRRHRYTTAADLRGRTGSLHLEDQWKDVSPAATAYLLYTSGTTQTPRAVPISHDRALRYLRTMEPRLQIEPDDRCSHTFALTFDLSIHDLFTTWSAGATLVPWTPSRGMDPARFINEYRLTRWFSVPTLAMTMERMGELRPERFRSLRTSLFCGEALSTQVARSWSEAAPQSELYNLYGPTEATIAVSCHRVGAEEFARSNRRETVCLGRIFDGHRAMIVGDDGRRTDPGEPGELWLAGPQVCEGYWQAPQATEQRFAPRHEGRGSWFRTGDRVWRDRKGRLHFLGRIDDHVKLRGHHVDLLEVDRALQQACGHSMACAVAWPLDGPRVQGLVGFVACHGDDPIEEHHLLASCRRILPNALVPDRLVALPTLPTNGCGKLDRRAMQRLLQQREV